MTAGWPTSLLAGVYNWRTGVDGVFSDPAKWTGISPPPGPGDAAYFNVTGSYSVEFLGDRTTEDLVADGGTVTFIDTTGPVSTYNLTDDLVADGGRLIIGGWSGNAMSIVAGNRVTLENGGRIDVGPLGELENEYGYIGYSNALPLYDYMLVSGSWANAAALTVGLSGHGVLDIGSTGEVSNTAAYVGRNSSGIGDAVIDGTWTCSSTLYIGYNGKGEMEIFPDGEVSNVSGYIGYSGTEDNTVRVDGGTWTNIGTLRVGYDGDGTLGVTNEGSVSCSDGEIASNTGSSGHVIVDVDSVFESAGDLSIGVSNTHAG